MLKETITIDHHDIYVKFWYLPGEPCIPNKFQAGSNEELELYEAFIEGSVKLYLDVSQDWTKDLIVEALIKKRNKDLSEYSP